MGSKNNLLNFRNYQAVINPCSLSVGASYGGGVIVHFFTSSEPGYIAGECHGIISSNTNQSTGIVWSITNTSIPSAQNSNIGYGKANTDAIVASQGSGTYAAKVCYDLNFNGYTDWYLPSTWELSTVNFNSPAYTPSVSYWTSTEVSSATTMASALLTSFTQQPKTSTYYIMAIRSF